VEIAITGSSGLIGTELVNQLKAKGHKPIRVVRRTPKKGSDEIYWKPAEGEIDAKSLEGIDGVINLAGAGVGDKRWTDKRKALIASSRVDSTTLLATKLSASAKQPKFLISGSAIGYYGNRQAEILNEQSTAGGNFLAEVCKDWEKAAQPAIDAGIRTCFARTGIVFTPKGGALGKLIPLFKFFLGGKLGNGKQYMSWISLEDEVRALMFLCESDTSGPVNLTAPNPVMNKEFTKSLGKALGRPTILPIPSFGPKILLGPELGQALALDSQRVLPKVLESEGFEFAHPKLDDCFSDIL